MVRIPQPRQRCDQHALSQRRLGAADEFIRQHAVRKDRHVPPVLFQSGKGENDGRIFIESGHSGPGEIG